MNSLLEKHSFRPTADGGKEPNKLSYICMIKKLSNKPLNTIRLSIYKTFKLSQIHIKAIENKNWYTFIHNNNYTDEEYMYIVNNYNKIILTDIRNYKIQNLLDI